MVSADSHRIPRAPCYWGPRPRSPPGSAYGAVTRCGPPSQGVRLPDRFNALRPAAAATGRTRPKQHRARNPRRVIARARFNHHPLPLATTHGISTPAGTEMFHFPASPPAPYDIQTRVTPHNGRRVPPFGNPRITARKPAPRGISQATASFIGPRCQGIHRTLIKTNNTQHNTRRTRDAHHTGARRTTNQTRKQTNGRPAAQFTIPRPPADARVHYAVHNQPARNPPNHATPPQNPPPGEPGEQNPKEAGPTRKGGAPNPGRTAPEPDSMPRPPHPPPGGDPDGPRTRRKHERGSGGEDPGPRPTARNPRPQRPRQLMNPLERR